ncbi:MAG: hypothetical protein QM747_03120 [Nocardioides sp.]
MPDSDTFDLDAAFRDLEHDVAGLSTPRGAGAAVSTARRRRRTRIGAVAAVAVLAVGGAAIGQSLHGRDQSVGPAGSLPHPAPLTAQALSSATDGWVSGWTARTPESVDSKLGSTLILRCVQNATSTTGDGLTVNRGSGNLFFTTDDTVALGSLVGYAASSSADALYGSVTSSMDRCPQATLTSERLWKGAAARSYAISSRRGPEQFWVAREGSAIGLVLVAGAPQQIPATSNEGVARALVAALEFPGSMKPVDNSSSSSSSSGSGSTSIPVASFRAALGDWQSGWTTSGDESGPPSTPCGVDLSKATTTGESLGANGALETASYSDAEAARAGVQSFVAALAACPGASYSSTDVPTSYGSDVTVVTGSGQLTQVVWVVRMGRLVGYVAIPAGDTAPPTAVSQAVGDLLLVDLKTNGGP